MKFSELQLNANVLEALDAMRFDECTPIQEQAIDYLKIQEKLSSKSRQVYEEIRSFFPVFTEDTPKYKEIEQMITYLKNKINTL